MAPKQLVQLGHLVKTNPSLIWYTKSYGQLDAEVITEAILNHGSWQEVNQLNQILGFNTASQIFQKLNSSPRNNLHPLTRHFFTLYYARHSS